MLVDDNAGGGSGGVGQKMCLVLLDLEGLD